MRSCLLIFREVNLHNSTAQLFVQHLGYRRLCFHSKLGNHACIYDQYF